MLLVGWYDVAGAVVPEDRELLGLVPPPINAQAVGTRKMEALYAYSVTTVTGRVAPSSHFHRLFSLASLLLIRSIGNARGVYWSDHYPQHGNRSTLRPH